MIVVKVKATRDYIIKLVKVLLKEVNTAIDLGDFGIKISEDLLRGEPQDENQKPVTTKITVSKTSKYQMSAYSFSVTRIKTNKV